PHLKRWAKRTTALNQKCSATNVVGGNLNLQSLRVHKSKGRRHAQRLKHQKKILLIGWCKNLRNQRRWAMSRSATQVWATKKKRCAKAAKLRKSRRGHVVIIGRSRSRNRWRLCTRGLEIIERRWPSCRSWRRIQIALLTVS